MAEEEYQEVAQEEEEELLDGMDEGEGGENVRCCFDACRCCFLF
jgi:hypothetical protein